MRYLLTLLILCFGIVGNAQQCLTDVLVEEALKDKPVLAQQLEEERLQLAAYAARQAHKTTNEKYIPVVVHVLYTRNKDNISENQIKSGLDILSLAFRAVNPDLGQVPAAFQPFIADTKVQFCLAAEDPWGNPTTGITRKEIPTSFNTNNDYYNPDNGGVRAWNPYYYLNIWVIDLPGNLLGFGWPPGVMNDDGDGIVIDYKAIGSIDEASSNIPHNLGKTLVHEAGHYFGLKHTWGNSQGCNHDDGVADTPPQYGPTGGCPAFPYRDQCSNVNGDGIMYMNYMDYSYDGCLVMFTQGQKNVIGGTLFGPRGGLGSPTRCFPVSAKNIQRSEGLSIAPNPTKDILHISSSKTIEHLALINMVGRVCKEIHPQARTYNVDMSTLPSGVYFVKLNNNEVYKVIKK